MAKREAPKSLRKLSLSDKKRFVDLCREGANTNSFFAYLSLNQGEVEYLKENLDEITKEVVKWEKDRAEKLRKDQQEATRINDLAKDTGTLVDDKKPGKADWKVPAGKEGEFIKDASRRTIDFMTGKWHNNKKAILSEIARLEGKK